MSLSTWKQTRSFISVWPVCDNGMNSRRKEKKKCALTSFTKCVFCQASSHFFSSALIWGSRKTALWSWVTGMNTESMGRGGSSFIINERSWDCFEHGFMQGNGGWVLDSFWAQTWWRIYQILLLPCAVFYYLQVSGSHTPAVYQRR